MTFEEFFIKKRIDLVQLQCAKPDLYEEFRSHYTLMGEKSFDHTKKYWFNRLRKEYPLTEAAAVVTEANVANVPTSEALATGSAATNSSKPSGFKPRFKAAVTQSAEATEQASPKPVEHGDPKKNAPPTGFKPRFKAGAIPPQTNTAKIAASNLEKPQGETTTDQSPDSPTTAAKPTGFKPRFKPGVTGKTKDAPEE
ncbi:hypothetical protein [Parapedobacter koreensis]|uniref:Uncharacterized protein n=1 Tax=Parapedobacter koreensis TaxID=332977 RepID=A0A1H7SUV7_9SPHI|nr:hypothetical protein [Parapedobacter koreensis]SEL76400.1 hypothetical protein SAMN05421740_109221 [Parapedobacter koreensis]